VKAKDQKGQERLGKLLGRTRRDGPDGKGGAKAKKPVEQFGRRATARGPETAAISAEERMLREVWKDSARPGGSRRGNGRTDPASEE
jgi:hypothetical protein